MSEQVVEAVTVTGADERAVKAVKLAIASAAVPHIGKSGLEPDAPSERSLGYYLGAGIDSFRHDYARHDHLLGIAARAAIAAARPMIEAWRPIESAPKDGTRIIICKWGWVHKDMGAALSEGQPDIWHLFFAVTASYLPDRNYWSDGLDRLVEPTHWMPLPAPPAIRALGDRVG